MIELATTAPVISSLNTENANTMTVHYYPLARWVQEYVATLDPAKVEDYECDDCNGYGDIECEHCGHEEKCDTCDGYGQIEMTGKEFAELDVKRQKPMLKLIYKNQLEDQQEAMKKAMKCEVEFVELIA